MTRSNIEYSREIEESTNRVEPEDGARNSVPLAYLKIKLAHVNEDDEFDFATAEIETARAGEAGSDLLIVNNGDGSDFLESTDGNCLWIGADGWDGYLVPTDATSIELLMG